MSDSIVIDNPTGELIPESIQNPKPDRWGFLKTMKGKLRRSPSTHISSSSISSPEAETQPPLSIDKARDGMLKMGDPVIDEIYKTMDGKDLPMVFRYKTPDGHIIYYDGTVHLHDLPLKQAQIEIAEIKKSFGEFDTLTSTTSKRIVFVEGGRPGIHNDVYSSYQDAVQQGGEMGAVTWFAKEAGIDVISPDIPPEETVAFMKKNGIDDLTIGLNFAFRRVHSLLREKQNRNEGTFSQSEVLDTLMGVSLIDTDWNRDYAQQTLDTIKKSGGFDSPEGKAQVQEFINTTSTALNTHLKQNTEFIENGTGERGIQLLVQNGTDQTGNPLYTSEYNPEQHYQTLTNPFLNHPDNPNGLLNKLSALISDNRDRYILDHLIQKVNEGYDIFTAFGNSHAIQEGAGLIAAGCTSPDYPINLLSENSDRTV